MRHQFSPLTYIFRRVIQLQVKLETIPHYQLRRSPNVFPLSSLSALGTFRAFHVQCDSKVNSVDAGFFGLPSDTREQCMPVNEDALRVQNLLRKFSNSPNEERSEALDNCDLSLTEDLVLDVLGRTHSDWSSAFQFFNWVSGVSDLSGYVPSTGAYNEMLTILGKARRFEEQKQMFDEMFRRGVFNERSYDIVLHRYAAAHKIDDVVEFFYKRKHYGLELDLAAFQSVLLALCRYKHVETAETLFLSKKGEYQYDIKTWNIILNGWCVLKNLHETKRFWNELIRSECKPDKYSYGTHINTLCKTGKVGTAVKLFRAMCESGCTPDAVICNSVIDGLCFKKRVPEALELFREMNAKDCQPDAGTYNCLIKYMCKIRRMEKASELLSEMEEKGGACQPNAMTYIHFLTAAKKPDEVASVLEKMKVREFKITGDIYNLVLRLYLSWNCEEEVQQIWADMLRDGIGPDQRSYTVMIHKRFEQGKVENALDYFEEMASKGMTPEPRTILLVDSMKTELELKESGETSNIRVGSTRTVVGS